jgi:hypothetical protein
MGDQAVDYAGADRGADRGALGDAVRYRWSGATMEKSRASVGIARSQHGPRIAPRRAAALPWRDAAVRPP